MKNLIISILLLIGGLVGIACVISFDNESYALLGYSMMLIAYSAILFRNYIESL